MEESFFLREYASYIKDSMVAELTDMNRNLMMSIDIVPVPTDEAVREAEKQIARCRNQHYELAEKAEYEQQLFGNCSL